MEGQLRQYLNQVQEEHKKKWQMINKLENNYKEQINNYENDRGRNYERELKAIERRGRVER